MLLALFLIDLAAGLYLFLPLVGRRNAGVKFYRLILITSGVLALCSYLADFSAHGGAFRIPGLLAIALTLIVYGTLRYPKRLIFRIPAALLGIVYIILPVAAWQEATHASIGWSIAGALSSVALLGSVNLAQTFMQLDLIDEYRININPTVLGQGKPFFADATREFPLKLLEAKTLKSGVVALRYEPVRG